MIETTTGFSQWMQTHLVGITTAMAATLLIVYGNAINRTLRKMLKGCPFAIRVAAFVLLCSFGYGMATVLAASLFADFLSGLDAVVLVPVVLCVFIALGIAAERKKQL